MNEDAMHAKRAEAVAVEAPQPVPSGVKKIAVGPAAAAPSKVQASAAANKGSAISQVDTRAKTPTTTFLTGGGWEADDDELAKARCIKVAFCVFQNHGM